MHWLNYHHLLYFWTVAREGGVTAASRKLRLAPATVSAQLRALEDTWGEKLFERRGRRLVLTDVGQVAFRYADDIFSLGRELVDAVQGRPTGRPSRLVVGVDDVLPKLVVRRLLSPATAAGDVTLVCREASSQRLVSELVLHSIDVVLSDAPAPPGAPGRAFSHLLGECGVTLFAAPALAKSLRRGFPRSLSGAPFLLPAEGSTARRNLDQWFAAESLSPRIAGEFADSALVDVFGADGLGAFAAPTVVEKEVIAQHRVQPIGRVPQLRSRFYALTVERRLRHPGVVAITDAARHGAFG